MKVTSGIRVVYRDFPFFALFCPDSLMMKARHGMKGTRSRVRRRKLVGRLGRELICLGLRDGIGAVLRMR